MGRLFFLVLVAAAAWYGWSHWSELRQTPRDEVVIDNQCGRGLLRVRLTIGSQTFVRETIAQGEKAVFRFPVTGDATFALKWQYQREEIDRTWSGGQITAGPLRTRHYLRVMPEAGVVWIPERMMGTAP
jgi:hypothetical protein